MVETVTNKALTLGGVVLLAQKRAKEALARQAVTAAPFSLDRVSDVVQISVEAQQKLANARSINNQLDAFRSFLKFLNKR